jgi:hypothetical protein
MTTKEYCATWDRATRILNTVEVGDKISGGRLDKYYAIVEEITPEYIGIRYNGECRTVKIKREHFAEIA